MFRDQQNDAAATENLCSVERLMDSELKTNYVLVDFENVQPKNLSMLLDDAF